MFSSMIHITLSLLCILSSSLTNSFPQRVTERPSFGIAVSGSGEGVSPKQELEALFEEVKKSTIYLCKYV